MELFDDARVKRLDCLFIHVVKRDEKELDVFFTLSRL